MSHVNRGTAGGRPYRTMHTTALSLTSHRSYAFLLCVGLFLKATEHNSQIINIQDSKNLYLTMTRLSIAQQIHDTFEFCAFTQILKASSFIKLVGKCITFFNSKNS